MKFLILALCVCAASAAVLQGYDEPPGSAFEAGVRFNPVDSEDPDDSFAYGARFAPGASFAKTAVYQSAKQVAAAAYQPAQQFATKTYSAAKDAEASIIRSDSEVGADGYNYNYETSNGITGQASGTLKKVGEEAVIVSQGTYSYVDPEGKTVTVDYVADENGFQPQSDILPVGPAIPEAIARALAYIAAHPSTSAEKY